MKPKLTQAGGWCVVTDCNYDFSTSYPHVYWADSQREAERVARETLLGGPNGIFVYVAKITKAGFKEK